MPTAKEHIEKAIDLAEFAGEIGIWDELCAALAEMEKPCKWTNSENDDGDPTDIWDTACSHFVIDENKSFPFCPYCKRPIQREEGKS
jgi:hypothetical protein